VCWLLVAGNWLLVTGTGYWLLVLGTGYWVLVLDARRLRVADRWPLIACRSLIAGQMRGAGLEPAPGCPEGILSPPRLPFRHPRKGRMVDVGCEMWVERHPITIGSDRSGSLSHPPSHIHHPSFRAGNGTRTRDPNLGKVVLYQLSYSRNT
jgi:hypothetical protein